MPSDNNRDILIIARAIKVLAETVDELDTSFIAFNAINDIKLDMEYIIEERAEDN